MITKYQLIILGADNKLIDEIVATFYRHILELGLAEDQIIVINEASFLQEYKANAPAYCLYFGDDTGKFRNSDVLNSLLNNATIILPVVQDLKLFNQCIPENLRSINGFELSSNVRVEQLVGSILEGLSLLRLSRRLFISYKRDESSTVAIQLFEGLEKAGFDVFLDTHSIRPGEPFQDELWHRLADTDIVVLLNTKKFLESNWTKQELARANSMSIGMLQVIWPDHKLEKDTQLSIPLQLTENDFGNEQHSNAKSYLNDGIIVTIVGMAESLRARSLAARQDNIVKEFIAAAHALQIPVDMQPEKIITLKNSGNSELVIIPTVGVPQAFTYNQSEELVERIKSKNISGIYLLYDHRNIREKWLKHLSWLDTYLPIKSIKIVEAAKWLKSI